VRLAPRQRARIATEERQMGGKFLAKGHSYQNSLEFFGCGVFGGAP
jgi:hypothetical protein